MPLDLTAARALHDRDPNNPEACPTCASDTDPHQMARWPCATALALGATGRSEWDNTDASTTYRNGYPIGDCEDPRRNGPFGHPGPCNTGNSPDLPDPRCSYTNAEGRCILNTSHRPGHVTGATDTPRCGNNRHNLTCAMKINHIGNCVDQDGIHWNACPTSRSSMGEIWPCTRHANHPESHRDQNGYTW